VLLDQVVLLVCVCALWGAALRVAAGLGAWEGRSGGEPSVLELSLAAVVLAAGFIVGWTLVLGLAGFSGSLPALAGGPVLAWVTARVSLPTGPRLSSELLIRWNRAPRAARAGALAALGVAAGALLEVAKLPGFDVDTLSYHLPDAFGWIHSGHAGTVQTFSYDFPVGYYPVTGEVLLSWLLGVSRSFAAVALLSVGAASLSLLGLWRLTVVLRAPRAVSIATVISFGTLPILLVGVNLNAAGTDVPAVAWLACTAALAFGAAERPGLLGPALLAAGLGIGTKTTVAPLAVLALAIGLWRARAVLRAVRPVLAGGLLCALVVAVPWYVRNTLTHGWPLWPFSSGPTGDPMPHAMSLFKESFLSRPEATVRALKTAYVDWFAGGLALIAAVPILGLTTRSRAARVAGVVALLALLSWAVAPFTGLARIPQLEPLALSTIRYILSALAACVVALAVAARDGSATRRWGVVALMGAASVWSVIEGASLGSPQVPNLWYLLAGGAAGALVGALAPRIDSRVVLRLGFAGAAAIAVAFLALAGRGWLFREAGDGSYDNALLSFMLAQPGFATGHQPVSFAPEVVASLAGERFSHPIELIPAREPCARVRARARTGWVVVFPKDYGAGITTAFDAAYCFAGERPIYNTGETVIYGRGA
jgi:hypothetical protein